MEDYQEKHLKEVQTLRNAELFERVIKDIGLIDVFRADKEGLKEIKACATITFMLFRKRMQHVNWGDPLKENNKEKQVIDNVLRHFIARTGKNIKTSVEAHRKHVRARIRDGYTLKEMIHVIDVKNKQWKGTKMDKYIRIKTLFTPEHFDSYRTESMQSDKHQVSMPDTNEKAVPVK